MRISIASTGDLYLVKGIQCRRWEGIAEDGTPCEVFVAAIGVTEANNCELFESALGEIGDPFSGDVVTMDLPLRSRRPWEDHWD